MENNQILYEIFSSSLGISLKSVADDLQYNGIPEWDSVAHMALVAELETKFGIMLDTGDIIDMSSVAKAREILAKYGVSFEASTDVV